MWRYIIFRLLQAVPVLFIVIFITFVTVRLVGDPAVLFAPPGATPEDIDQLRIQFGLDKPLVVQFFTYMANVLRGDFGVSLRWNIPVLELWASRLPYTLLLGVAVGWIGAPLGMTLGILSTIHVNKWPDNLIRFLAFMGMSMPGFWIAIMLVMIFAVRLGWFPTSGWQGPEYLVLPTVAMLIGGMAGGIRFTRTLLLDAMDQEYIKTARIKGVHWLSVILKHGFRNAAIPVITSMILGIPGMLGGALVIELIFNWPGIGRLMIEAVYARDFPLIQGTALLGAALFLICSIAVDIAYVYIDPRIRYR